MCFANAGPSLLRTPMLFDTSRCVSDLIIEFIRKILDSTDLGSTPVISPIEVGLDTINQFIYRMSTSTGVSMRHACEYGYGYKRECAHNYEHELAQT